MDDMNEFIPMDPIEEVPMEELMPETGLGMEQLSVPFMGQDPIPEMPSTDVNEMDFNEELLNSESILKSSVI